MTETGHIADAAPRGYQVLLELGRGGMGAAFLARAEGAGGFERLVVIKRIRPERVDLRNVERFLREAKLAAAIHHANVVGAQNVGEDGEGPFIVLDYVDGASLEELLDRSLLRQRALPVPIALRVALDSLAGLEAVHGASDAQGTPLNVLHRDVSLQNILVGRDGVARVLDFGIARSNLGGATTDQRYLVGKLPYLPPEYLRRQALTPAADVYGLGVTLWFALTGKDLWPGASEAQLMQHILNDGIPRLSQTLQVAPEIDELVARACASNHLERFGTARAMATEIERLGRDRGWLASHSEVAQWVEELAGTDLKRRREQIATIVGTEALRAPLPTTHDTTAPRGARQASGRARRFFPWVMALVAVAVLSLTAWLLTRGSGNTAATTRETRSQSSTPAAAALPEAPVLAGAPSPPTPAISAASEPGSSPSGRPPTRASSPAPKPNVTPGVRPPNQISKRNPYRD